MSRRDFFISQYFNLQNEIKMITNNNFLPSLEDFDVVDIIYMFSYTFVSVSKYDDIVIELLKNNGIKLSQDQLNQLLPICSKYINSIKQVL